MGRYGANIVLFRMHLVSLVCIWFARQIALKLHWKPGSDSWVVAAFWGSSGQWTFLSQWGWAFEEEALCCFPGGLGGFITTSKFISTTFTRISAVNQSNGLLFWMLELQSKAHKFRCALCVFHDPHNSTYAAQFSLQVSKCFANSLPTLDMKVVRLMAQSKLLTEDELTSKMVSSLNICACVKEVLPTWLLSTQLVQLSN